jgi:4'-phosphopantetheinyl transferase
MSLVDADRATVRAPLWETPPEFVRASEEEVHVWCASLDPKPGDLGRLWRTLSPDERERADRFQFEANRHDYVVARGLLRSILGRYLRRAPGELRFSYSPYGKPALAPGLKNGGLCFNVSHSGRLALYAIARNRRVGVDIERLRHDVDTNRLAEQFFSRHEVAALRATPSALRQELFFACWTRKEAFIKARGEGLSLALDSFDVSLAPGEPAALLATRGDHEDASRWALRELAPHPNYAAALAVEGHGWQLRCWRWED